MRWGKQLISTICEINSLDVKNDDNIIICGYKAGEFKDDGFYLSSDSSNIIAQISNIVGIPEIQELTVENEKKEFDIVTSVKEIDGGKRWYYLRRKQ